MTSSAPTSGEPLDHHTGRSTVWQVGMALAGVEPAPRPFFDGPFPYAQRMDDRDAALFLARTAGQTGHTFTKG